MSLSIDIRELLIVDYAEQNTIQQGHRNRGGYTRIPSISGVTEIKPWTRDHARSQSYY